MPIEHEVKLAFTSLEAARRAVHTAGGRLVVSQRLIDDRLFDTPDRQMYTGGTTVRIRRDGVRAVVTWKGPVQAGPVKSREEIETGVDDPAVIETILAALTLRPSFRSQKYREEYALDGATLTVDDTPMGVFVEIEAAPAEIERLTIAMGRTPADYCLESYSALWRQWTASNGLSTGDMLFPKDGSRA